MDETRNRGRTKREEIPKPTPEQPVVRVERKIFRCLRDDGTMYYRLDFRACDGRRVREPVGESLTDARRLRAQREHEVNAGTYQHPEDRKREAAVARAAAEAVPDRGPTFAKFSARFLRDYGDLRRSTYYADVLSLSRPIMAYFGERYVREIAPADLDAFRRHRTASEYQGRRVSGVTVRKDLTVLGTMFRMARRWGVIETNPALDVEKPPESQGNAVALTPEEWERVRDALPEEVRPVAVFALATGSRLREAVGVRWSDVDRRGGFVYFTPENKSARPKRVKIGAAVNAVLAEADRKRREIAKRTDRLTEYVFTLDDGADFAAARARNRVSQRYRAAASAVGVRTSFKALRTTAATWAEEAGVPVGETRMLLGHADVRTTQRYYIRSEADRTANAVSALDRRLMDLDTKRTLDSAANGERASAVLDSAR